jgi:PilZ domain
MEHRWGQRHDFEQMVLLRAAGWRVLARIKNISVSGAYLRCAVPESGVGRIRVDFRRQPPRSAELVAYVVRRTPEGIGIEWGEFGCRAVTRLLGQIRPDAAEAGAPSAACSSVSAIAKRNASRRRRGHGS